MLLMICTWAETPKVSFVIQSTFYFWISCKSSVSFCRKIFRVCISKKIKTARREGQAVLVDLLCYVSAHGCAHSIVKQKVPNLLRRSGCGRRERGDANALNILGWILLRLQNVSILLTKSVSPKLKCHLLSKVEMSLLGVVTFSCLESGVAK